MRSSIFCLFFFCALVAHADTARVIATGDSLTGMYYWYLPGALQRASIDGTAPNLSFDKAGSNATFRGGINAAVYSGSQPYPGENTPINYANDVLKADPDVILFMLGTNNIPWGNDNLDAAFQSYKTTMAPIFEQWSNYKNSRGVKPQVILGSILPFDVEKNSAFWGMPRPAGAMEFLGNTWNPWLAQEAAQLGFTYLDNFNAIQQVPNWKNTMLASADGLHLSNAGSDWVATRFCSAIVVPEPSAIVLLGMGILGLLAWRKARAK